jgi:hypothetical protein
MSMIVKMLINFMRIPIGFYKTNYYQMNEIKIKDQKKSFKNWILPGNSLSQDEFLFGISKAEEGPFYTVQESMENFEQWLKSRERK